MDNPKKFYKVVINGEDIVNLSEADVDPADVSEGKKFFTPYGILTTGIGSEIREDRLKAITIYDNGTYSPQEEEGSYVGYSSVEVKVNTIDEDSIGTITVEPKVDKQTIEPTESIKYFNKVIVEPIPERYIIPTGSRYIDTNGEFNVAQYERVDVNVPSGAVEDWDGKCLIGGKEVWLEQPTLY